MQNIILFITIPMFILLIICLIGNIKIGLSKPDIEMMQKVML